MVINGYSGYQSFVLLFLLQRQVCFIRRGLGNMLNGTILEDYQLLEVCHPDLGDFSSWATPLEMVKICADQRLMVG